MTNMRIKSNYYFTIIEKYRELRKRKCLDDLLPLFPDIPRMTLESIIFQECQRKTKKSYHYHAAPHNVKKYYDRLMQECEKNWNQCGILLRMADEVDLSPALMAKLILEYHYNENTKEKKDADTEVHAQKPKIKVNDLIKNPSLIDDPFLAAEVKMCVLEDDAYGHASDIIRKFVGQEYENKLKEELRKLGLTFSDSPPADPPTVTNNQQTKSDENQLRERGYDKTPDVKLDVPIAVDGHVINWIESKASFGDEERHKEYLRDQYWSYCNRFGPGLVIYWAGYIEELNTDKDHGIMISDKFPSEMIKMDPTVLVNQSYSI